MENEKILSERLKSNCKANGFSLCFLYKRKINPNDPKAKKTAPEKDNGWIIDQGFVTLNETVAFFGSPYELEDVSEKGHWGVGKTQMRVFSDQDVWKAAGYLDELASKKAI